MTSEVVSVIVAIIGAAGIVFGGQFALMRGLEARMYERMDLRFDQVDKRFDQVDKQFSRVDEQFASVHEELGRVKDDVVALQVAVARLEGPQPTLLKARG